MSNAIISFGEKPIRRIWNEQDLKWYFAIADVVAALTDSVDPQGYIKDMRRRDAELAKGWGQIATPLVVPTAGGKQKLNCANTEGILRIIQSIPSPKAEPFKRWLARVGYERLEEIENPELSKATFAKEIEKNNTRAEPRRRRELQNPIFCFCSSLNLSGKVFF